MNAMNIIMNEITSRECRRYLDRGGDLVFAPVGAVERLGPHLPLGARNMVVSAIARLLAEQNGGLCLPVVPYATVYDTYAQRGGIDVPPEFMHRYCYDICRELEANAFRRIVFVSFQEELYYLSHEYFQERNLTVVYLNPDAYFNAPETVAAALDAHGRELWRLIGCLRADGDTDMLARVLDKTRDCFNAYEPIINENKRVLDKLGTTGHQMGADEWRFYPVSLGKSLGETTAFEAPDQSVIDRARDELVNWVRSLGPSIADMSKYQNYLDGIEFTRPI